MHAVTLAVCIVAGNLPDSAFANSVHSCLLVSLVTHLILNACLYHVCTSTPFYGASKGEPAGISNFIVPRHVAEQCHTIVSVNPYCIPSYLHTSNLHTFTPANLLADNCVHACIAMRCLAKHRALVSLCISLFVRLSVRLSAVRPFFHLHARVLACSSPIPFSKQTP